MDGLLMNRLTTRSLYVAAIALACTVVGTARAADISVPPDPGARDARTLVSFACSKCHGPSGNGVSISPLFPILAGQNPVYIDTELKLLRQHGRSDPHARAFMWGISHALTDEQIQGLAQYFSSQPAVSNGTVTMTPMAPAAAIAGPRPHQRAISSIAIGATALPR